MPVLISYLTKEALETTVAAEVADLRKKLDDVVNTRGGTPILAHTATGKKVCLQSSSCMNCSPETCPHRPEAP